MWMSFECNALGLEDLILPKIKLLAAAEDENKSRFRLRVDDGS